MNDLSYIHPDLWALAKPIGTLHPHPRNARRHPERNIVEIMGSLRQHGQTRAAVFTPAPMDLGDGVLPAGVVLVGSGMLLAAQRLGWECLAAISFQGSVMDARQLALQDNRTAELAEWDYEVLSAELKALSEHIVDLATIGWTPYEAAPLLEAMFLPGEPIEGASSTGTNDEGAAGTEEERSLRLTVEQCAVLDTAVVTCRERCANPALTTAECVAIIAKEYVDGR